MSNAANIPEMINCFNAYHNGNKMIGVTSQVTLPTLDAIEEEISGAGILGSYQTSTPGNFSSMTQEVPFRTLDDDLFKLMNPNEPVDLTFRASEQSTVKATGALDYKSMRVVERGRFKSFSGGTLEQGKPMNATLTLELLYILVEIDGVKMLEYDKLNSVFVANGVDLLEKVRNYT